MVVYRNNRKQFFFFSILVLLIFYFVFPRTTFAQEVATTSSEALAIETPDTFFRAKVIRIVSEEAQEEFGETMVNQKVLVELTSGTEKGKELTVDYAYRVRQDSHKALMPGVRVVVNKSVQPDGVVYYVSEVYRLRAVWILLSVFIGLVILLAGRRGVMAFIGLAMSVAVILGFMIPRISAGSDPLHVSVIGTIAIAAASILVAHGWKRRTRIALMSTFGTIIISFILALLAVRFTQLFGMGSEEAFYLQFAPLPDISLRGILLGGILIGLLGVLDDVTTAQAAAVEEIHRANASFGFLELYRRGMSVGIEHIISLVNTLALAYMGASFPILLLLFAYPRPFWVTLNSEPIVEEIVRTLVGSTGIFFAVPLTTCLAAWVYSRRQSESK